MKILPVLCTDNMSIKSAKNSVVKLHNNFNPLSKKVKLLSVNSAIALATLSAFPSCTNLHQNTTSKDIQIDDDNTKYKHTLPYIEISGILMMSALGIKKIKDELDLKSVVIDKNIMSKTNALENIRKFAKHGINITEIDKDELFTIDSLNVTKKEDVKFVKENFHKIKKIKNSAKFSNIPITSLQNLEEIGGNADFSDSNVNNLGKLKIIGGNANFSKSNIISLGKLKKIGGNANFSPNCTLKKLGKLQEIGGNANFSWSIISSLSNLKRIQGNAVFTDCNITDFGALEFINSNVYYDDSTEAAFHDAKKHIQINGYSSKNVGF